MFKAVILDFDYTLADSSKGAISCINYALDKMGLNTVSDEIACRTVGLSLKNTFLKLCDEEYVDKTNEFSKLFIEQADRVMADLTKIYESVPKTMRILKAKGIKLGIVSGKFRYRINEILKRADLQEIFDYIVGGEDVVNQKPNPEGVLKVIEKFNLKPEEILYIGDSLIDQETAKTVGMSFIATLTGETKKHEFNDLNVFKYIDDISELLSLFHDEKVVAGI